MTDMSPVIVPKSDQINADDLIAGPRTVRIRAVRIQADTEQPVSIAIVGEKRVYRPCKSMSRVLVAGWGADSSAYAGRYLTLYRDADVQWGGMKVGGIRISHMSHIDRPLTLALSASKTKRAITTIRPLKVPESRAESSSVSPDDADPGPATPSHDDGSAPSSPDASEAGMRCEAALKAATTLTDVQALRTDRQFKADMNWLHKNDASLFDILAGMIKRLEGEMSEAGDE